MVEKSRIRSPSPQQESARMGRGDHERAAFGFGIFRCSADTLGFVVSLKHMVLRRRGRLRSTICVVRTP